MHYYITEQYLDDIDTSVSEEIPQDICFETEEEAFRGLIDVTKEYFLKLHNQGCFVTYIRPDNIHKERILLVTPPDLKKYYIKLVIQEPCNYVVEDTVFTYIAIWGEGYGHSNQELFAQKCFFSDFGEDNGYDVADRKRIAALNAGESIYLGQSGEHWIVKL